MWSVCRGKYCSDWDVFIEPITIIQDITESFSYYRTPWWDQVCSNCRWLYHCLLCIALKSWLCDWLTELPPEVPLNLHFLQDAIPWLKISFFVQYVIVKFCCFFREYTVCKRSGWNRIIGGTCIRYFFFFTILTFWKNACVLNRLSSHR